MFSTVHGSIPDKNLYVCNLPGNLPQVYFSSRCRGLLWWGTGCGRHLGMESVSVCPVTDHSVVFLSASHPIRTTIFLIYLLNRHFVSCFWNCFIQIFRLHFQDFLHQLYSQKDRCCKTLHIMQSYKIWCTCKMNLSSERSSVFEQTSPRSTAEGV